MRKFLLRLLFFLPVPILMAGVNYHQDAANLFSGGKYEAGLAHLLGAGRNVSRVGNYDERLLQRMWVRDMPRCPETVVLGSSREMLIGSDYARGGTLRNNAVSGASLEDYVAVYHLYQQRNCVPARVIIGADPWLLNDHHGQTRWETLRAEYNEMAARLGVPTSGPGPLIPPHVTRLGELFSFSYFKGSMQDLLAGRKSDYIVVSGRVNPELTRLSDGSIYYGEAYRHATIAEAEAHARQCIADGPIYSLGAFDALSPRYTDLFRRFVDYLQSQGSRVEFVMPPYHPVIYRYFRDNPDYKQVLAAEAWFRKIAMERKIPVYGSYDPARSGTATRWFYDGYHCNDTAIAGIMAR